MLDRSTTLVAIGMLAMFLLSSCEEEEQSTPTSEPTQYSDWEESPHGYSYRHVRELGCDALVIAFDTHMDGVGASIDGVTYSFQFLPLSLQGPDCRVSLDVDSIPSFDR